MAVQNTYACKMSGLRGHFPDGFWITAETKPARLFTDAQRIVERSAENEAAAQNMLQTKIPSLENTQEQKLSAEFSRKTTKPRMLEIEGMLPPVPPPPPARFLRY
jgi:hypothetical protein